MLFSYSVGLNCCLCLDVTTLSVIFAVLSSLPFMRFPRLGCQVDIRKIRRCSYVGAEAADRLSKSDIGNFFKLVPEANLVPQVVPRAFSDWVLDPK